MGKRQILRSPWLLAGACVALALWVGACSSSPTPPDDSDPPDDPAPPTLTRVTAPVVVDTIDAEPTDPYVLAVANGDGTPVVGTTVSFSGSNAQVAVPGGAFGTSASVLTDSRGEVAVMVRYGPFVGAGTVIARVPTVQLGDTLEIDVRPGAPVNASISPRDVLAVVGVPFTVTAAATDRRGNVVGGAVPVAVDFGPITTAGEAFVGTRFGLGRLSATVLGVPVLATVRVVPDGEIVYTKGTTAWLSGFDGSGIQALAFAVPSVLEPSVSWNPAGDRIVLGGFNGFVVFDLTTRTVLPASWPGGLAGSGVLWPRFGPGGKIHYSSSDGHGAWDLRQMNPDGSAPAITIASDRFPNNDFFPDWAPDGSRFAFTADWEQRNRFLLRISDPTATTITTIDLVGTTHVWSPDGTLIAYQELGNIGVVSPDGFIRRRWAPGWSKGVTWSPDGSMLVGLRGGEISILDVETGETMVLSHLGSRIDAVAWRPE